MTEAKKLETSGLVRSSGETDSSEEQLGMPLAGETGCLLTCCADSDAENRQTAAEVYFLCGVANSCRCLICRRFARRRGAQSEQRVLRASDVNTDPCRQLRDCQHSQ